MPWPFLYPANVEIVTPRLQAGFDDQRAAINERANGVADDLCAGKKFRQFLHRSSDLGNFKLRRLDSRDVIHCLFDFRAISSGGNEGNVVLAKIFHYQPAGKATCSVDNHRLLLGHCGFLLFEPGDPGKGRDSPE